MVNAICSWQGAMTANPATSSMPPPTSAASLGATPIAIAAAAAVAAAAVTTVLRSRAARFRCSRTEIDPDDILFSLARLAFVADLVIRLDRVAALELPHEVVLG